MNNPSMQLRQSFLKNGSSFERGVYIMHKRSQQIMSRKLTSSLAYIHSERNFVGINES